MLKRRIIGVIGISLWAGLLVFAVIAELEGKAKVAEQTEQVSKSEAGAIEISAKDLVGVLASGDFDKATENFDGTMKKVLPAEKLREAWNTVIDKFGPFAKQIGARKEKIMGYDVIFVTCEFEKGILDVKVVFNGDKEVAGLFFVPSQSFSNK